MDMDRDRVHDVHIERDEIIEGRKGGTVAAAYPGAMAARPTESEAGEVAYLGHSRATWPSIWAGFFIGTMAYVLMNVLGMALGLTWLNNDAVTRGELQTASAIWLIVTSLISFFVGGYVTGRMMSLPGRGTGAMNGFLYGCFSILLLATFSIAPVLGNLPTIASVFMRLNLGAQSGMQVAPGNMQAWAWWSFIGLAVALGAATVGGMFGARRADVDPLTTGDEHTHGHQRRAEAAG